MSGRHNRFVTTHLKPAIESKTCPICLSTIPVPNVAVLNPCLHAFCFTCIQKWSGFKRICPLCNSEFQGWFFNIDLASTTFLQKRLFPEEARRPRPRPRPRPPLALHRVVRRSTEEFSCSNRRSRPLPRRRWFGKPGPESSDDVAQRILRWRSSIYEQRLHAVPHFSHGNLLTNTTVNNMVKERIVRRIEPWIRRELEAILGDPDPSIIVHVISSLFISSLESPPNQSSPEDNFLEPLRPFLHELTNTFWHELRCFAGSPFNMETYDTLVEYKKRRELV